ncbi:DUF3530 family protein [Alteromonas pelagimontana]|uniref:DUF3530 family protein n=1 Tax=Alteromonas pelagimontana TaxID=1858656 RepID=A0A6M4MB63_9ALTE|nr:DUF3530 family protein [Alteromonas pelagimontana]QJR80393.1 DUF3530 family protein [Alteromonas pelagimontana]
MGGFLVKLVMVVALMLVSAICFADSRVEDIKLQYRESEYTTVLVGDTAVPVFIKPAAIPLSRGVALIVVDGGYYGLSLQDAKTLATQLNLWGWDTLISPTLLDDSPVNPATGTAPADLPDTSIHPRSDSLPAQLNFTDSQTRLTLLMNALYNKVEDKKGFRLVISQGMTAAQLVSLGAAEKIPMPDSMVVIAPFWPQEDANKALVHEIADTNFPVLDISLPDSNRWQKQTVTTRRQAAIVALKLHYRQRQMKVQPVPSFQPYTYENPFVNGIGKEIYGWITYLGW